ncbi:MAG TPA: hypothetical protein VN372_04175 [Methanospirillum sp.]|nr:hypothetical protein [Methanospirillum sp.]
MESDDEAYPHVSGYDILTIEGHCMLNLDYIMKKDPYNFRHMQDGSFQEVDNLLYDPSCKPEPYPEGCLHFVNPSCISCTHFGWCEADEESADDESAFSHPE